MPKPYDAVSKYLIDLRPADWLKFIGVPADDSEAWDVELLDTDLSTITSQSDRVIKVNAPHARLQHVEFESGHHGTRTPTNLLLYNVLLRAKYNLPVGSTVILLRRESDSPLLTGRMEYHDESGAVELLFDYRVVRVWRIPVESLLAGGIGTLALAPLASVTPDQLPDIIRRMQTRIDAEVGPEEERELWTAASILMGLRFPRNLTEELLKGVRQMRESVTYQAILQEGEQKGRELGRAEEARSVILRLGQRQYGEPSAAIEAAVEAIRSVEVLARLEERLLEVKSWDDLLADS